MTTNQTSQDKDFHEKILRKALNTLYSTPQQAFMDGSYKRIREAISLAISETIKAKDEEFIQELKNLSKELQNFKKGLE